MRNNKIFEIITIICVISIVDSFSVVEPSVESNEESPEGAEPPESIPDEAAEDAEEVHKGLKGEDRGGDTGDKARETSGEHENVSGQGDESQKNFSTSQEDHENEGKSKIDLLF